jgi:hypothetical protein
VLVNDADADIDPLQAVSNTLPASGTLAFSEDGSFTYAPASEFVGVDGFTYRACDGWDYSNVASVTITVEAIPNAPPVSLPDAYTITEGLALEVSAPGVLANDTDADMDPLQAVSNTLPASGTLALGADGSFTYMPAPGFVGVDGFTYRASDGLDHSPLATVAISVVAVPNIPPLAVADAYTTAEGLALEVFAPGVLVNDRDADMNPLMALLDTAPSEGACSLAPDGSFVYTPAVGFSGLDRFYYYAWDGKASSNVVAVTIAIAPSIYAAYLPVLLRAVPLAGE